MAVVGIIGERVRGGEGGGGDREAGTAGVRVDGSVVGAGGGAGCGGWLVAWMGGVSYEQETFSGPLPPSSFSFFSLLVGKEGKKGILDKTHIVRNP